MWVWLLVGINGLCYGLPKLSIAPRDELTEDHSWSALAIQKLWKERLEMEHTPIIPFKYSARPDVDIIFKDESSSRTGSLKHRYALMLMAWALREGKIGPNTTVYEASSGNTANSLAYMCKLIGIKFVAIVPNTLETIKQKHIEEHGGSIIRVPIGERLTRARDEANRNGGFFMNQFGNADKAEDFHESGNYPLESANIFHELVLQLKNQPNMKQIPDMFVHAAGTGGTITSVGRYVRKYNIKTQIVLADTQFSVYFDYVRHHSFINESGASLWINPGMSGIGYGPMGPARHGETTSLDPGVIDRAIKVPDLASTAAMAVLKNQGLSGGPSSGVNFLSALHLAAVEKTKQKTGQRLLIITILADRGINYEFSYYSRDWIAKNFKQHGGLLSYICWIKVIEEALIQPIDPLQEGFKRCGSGSI